MFCPKCGNEIPDQSTNCAFCGSQIVSYAQGSEQMTQVIDNTHLPTTAAVTGNTLPIPPTKVQDLAHSLDMPNAYASQQNTTYAQPFSPASSYAPVQAPTKKRRKLPIFIALVALVVLALLAFGVFRGFNTPNPAAISNPDTVVEQAVSDLKDLNFDGLLDSVPPELLDYALAHSEYSTREELVAFLNEQFAQLDEQISVFGLSTKDILKVVNVETSGLSYYSEDGLTSLKSEWNSRIPGFGDRIENAATVNVEFTGEIELFGQKVSLSDYIGSASQPVTVAQVDGQWYLLESDVSNMGELANML